MIDKIHHVSTLLKFTIIYLSVIPEILGSKGICNDSAEMLEFDSLTQMCCGGHVISRFTESYQEKGCCGSVTYNKDRQTCCGDKVMNKIRPSGTRQYCCGTNIYQQSTRTLCCGISEQILYTDAGGGDNCCGIHKYNRKLSECCWDNFGNITLHSKEDYHQCCGAKYYNTRTQDCVDENSIMIKGRRMCGAVEYNIKEQFCCVDKLYNSPGHHQLSCCEDIRYNTTTHKCCWDADPHVIPINAICCGKGSYDPEKQRCCMSKVMNISSPEMECCGSHLYNTLTESCCMPGHTVFNKVSNRCCKGSVVDIHRQCCGSMSYLPSQQVCCNNEFPIQKRNSDDNRCCVSRNINESMSYDSSKQRCVIQNNESHLEKRIPRCGWKIFNEASDLCCNMELIQGGVDNGLRCCSPGRLAFNPRSQICCNSVVYNKTERNRCHGNRIHPVTKHKQVCDICSLGQDYDLKHGLKHFPKICHKNVIEFRIKRQRKIGKRTKLIGKIKSSLNDQVRRKRSRTLSLPCHCVIRTKHILVITNRPIHKKHIHLRPFDSVIPYSRENEMNLRNMFEMSCTTHA